MVSDINQSANSLNVEWLSNIDGTLGSVLPDSDGTVQLHNSNLSEGEHILTLSVIDDMEQSCVESLTFTVADIPVIQSLSLSPDPAYTNDILTTTVSSLSSSGTPADSYVFDWYINQTVITSTAPTLYW